MRPMATRIYITIFSSNNLDLKKQDTMCDDCVVWLEDAVPIYNAFIIDKKKVVMVSVQFIPTK